MGQDEIYLQVIATSGEESEKKNATKVLRLLNRGKHWVLVTLLVGNVITNETLPIVLDRSLGGGYVAAITSAVLVIIFGEIIPQSVCVRYGLPLGAWTSPAVVVLMWLFCPITWPIAKLLDYILGKGHGMTYKKAGLKTLVGIHRTLGVGSDRLNEDEVSIISGVLDLKGKSVGTIMTPMKDVFTLPANAILDEEMMDTIMREGYSRIPIHETNNPSDFCGMLLVKMLITYDPEDARKVSEFSLATLPETRPETSCLDIINFFQQGKSHMVLVSQDPGATSGALGVVTLEDVIEELIGEEIIDESDVYVDVHKAIRRLQPAPFHRNARLSRGEAFEAHSPRASITEADLIDVGLHRELKETVDEEGETKLATTSSDFAKSPKTAFLQQRRQSGDSHGPDTRPGYSRQYTAQMKDKLRNLGPSNAAKQPKSSKVPTVKIKPAVDTIPENVLSTIQDDVRAKNVRTPPLTSAQDGIGVDTMSPGLDAKDGVQAIHQGPGSTERNLPWKENESDQRKPSDSSEVAISDDTTIRPIQTHQRNGSHSTIGSIRSQQSQDGKRKTRASTRSGSIHESFVERGGVKKLVLETTSSSEEPDGEAEKLGHEGSSKGAKSHQGSKSTSPNHESTKDGSTTHEEANVGHKKKKRKHHKKKPGAGEHGKAENEHTPLLQRGSH